MTTNVHPHSMTYICVKVFGIIDKHISEEKQLKLYIFFFFLITKTEVV